MTLLSLRHALFKRLADRNAISRAARYQGQWGLRLTLAVILGHHQFHVTRS